MWLNEAQRIVVKVGSSSIVDTNSETIFVDRLASIAEDISWLSRDMGKEVILMSSGALAWGRICMNAAKIGASYQDNPRIAGACGQVGIASAWSSSFRGQEMALGQLLLIPENVSLQAVRTAILGMLGCGIVPYINENIPTLEAYDNDGLAAEVARQLDCDALILLSDVEGVYSSNPMTNPGAVLIPEINDIDEALRRFGGGASSGLGTGGMLTKLRAAKTMSAMGIETIIASGERLNPLKNLADGVSGTIVRA